MSGHISQMVRLSIIDRLRHWHNMCSRINEVSAYRSCAVLWLSYSYIVISTSHTHTHTHTYNTHTHVHISLGACIILHRTRAYMTFPRCTHTYTHTYTPKYTHITLTLSLHPSTPHNSGSTSAVSYPSRTHPVVNRSINRPAPCWSDRAPGPYRSV